MADNQNSDSNALASTSRAVRRISLGLLAIVLFLAALWAAEELLVFLSAVAQLGLDLLLGISMFKDMASHGPWLNLVAHLAIIVVALIFVYLLGCLFKEALEQWLFRAVETLAMKTPFIRAVYLSTTHVADSFKGQKPGLFKRVVLIEYPRVGIYSVGFVTNEETGNWEARARTGKELLSVFVPNTPNPINGVLLLVPRGELVFLDMPVSDAMRMIVSGGSSTPMPWTGTPPSK